MSEVDLKLQLKESNVKVSMMGVAWAAHMSGFNLGKGEAAPVVSPSSSTTPSTPQPTSNSFAAMFQSM